ncbi:MAG: chemotaxis protein CheW [Rhodospirillales bacterium]|nr:chemotaxis protein CheW [Rhodospirillales bacterium]MCW8860957.1 chemotaxis protein CheW [Rhodospirillales bacterium]MCW8951272.1 chemotaxis protein CheW [Rhodospirillales bacterium]MCW9001337.1 chemotaxis protein CheW [Rhodospirillales bacterium]
MDDLLSEFLTETSESLNEIDQQLVAFEQNPNDTEILSNIFRLVHTIKGTSGFLGLPRLEKVAHAGEDVLGKFRDGALEVTPDAVSLILRCIDQIRELLGALEETEAEPEGDDSQLISELRVLAEGNVTAAPPSLGGASVATPAKEPEPEPEEEPSGGGPVLNEHGFPVAAELLAEVEAATSQGVQAASEEEMMAEMAAEMEAAADAPAEAKVPAPKASPPAKVKAADNAPAEKKESSVATQTIRVNVDLLENLMTLVSELVLTRNQLLQIVRGMEDSEFTVPLQRLSHITSDLQEGVMKTRMQPIGNAWAKLPRIVRDLTVESGKKIDLQMKGAETELDRQVLELIKDPLTHMVRNSADHGLEGPKDRLAAGKREIGTILLNAFHEGGHIIIEISDDGRGLNMDRIKEKVVMNGLASDSDLEAMSEQQIQQFIFKAGFSTAEKVTSVSGRGVGMDVVRTNIEKIGGTISLKSTQGSGSTFTIKIPLTLAIVSGLIVECGGERFAIPQISVLELVRASAHSEHAIEMINDAPVLRLRNRLLPLVALDDLLRIGSGKRHDMKDETFIVVTQVGTYTFGILVDRVFDTEEIVVKPVAPILRDISVYSGNTILGDGSVIMILDPNGIAAATGEIAMDSGASAEDAVSMGAATGDEKVSVLIFRAGSEELKAVPLALVARLEDIELDKVEHSGGRSVVQYRGQLMPLIPINVGHKWQTEGRQPVLVFTDRDHSMGLVVDEIVDIVEDRMKIELSSDQDGLVGSAIVAGKATDIIDAGYYLTQAFSDWFGSLESGGVASSDAGNRKVLLVDDSPFFRNLLSPVLSVAGYTVTTAEDAGKALSMRERGMDFDVIVSDIEMPGMNGFEFAEEIKSGGRWSTVPLVALSSHATDSDFDRGRQAGFSDYVAKFDRDALLRTLSTTVAHAISGAED